MRRLLSSLILLMPLVAAAQTLGGIQGDAIKSPDPVSAYTALRRVDSRGHLLVPLWRDSQGRMLALVGTRDDHAGSDANALDFKVVDVSQGYNAGLYYDIGPHVAAYANLAEHNWLTPKAVSSCTPSLGIGCPDANTLDSARLMSSELGASYNHGPYRFDLLFDSSRPRNASLYLPRVVPSSPAFSGVPLWALDHSSNVSARGRFALGGDTGIDLGASVGRIRLLPGNMLGVHALGQQSVSLGMDSGDVSGQITGRMLQPAPGSPDVNALGPERHWTTIDLGVTWRLPWQGELRFGAQNLWSSGQPLTPADGPGPDQSRIPYVQYHQDL